MISNELKIYTIGFSPIGSNKTENLKLLVRYMQDMPSDTDLVVLPELFTTGFITSDINLIAELAEKNTGTTIDVITKLAAKFNVAIAGTFLALTNIYYYNRAFFIEPSGDCTYYDKHYLFSLGDEPRFYKKGNTLPPIIRYRGWNIMPVVCYDIRFPEWCRNVDRKYDILLVMANWPVAREYAWTHLLIARAIENQCYVCAVNRSGIDNNGWTYPDQSSMVLNYKGKAICKLYKNDTSVAICNKEKYNQYIDKFPVWKDVDQFTIHID